MTNWKKIAIGSLLFCLVVVKGAFFAKRFFSHPTPPPLTPHLSQLVAWGDNDFGQLGIHSDLALKKDTPLASVQLTQQITQVVAGINFSLAVTKNGEVYSWGSNTAGQLGTGGTGRELAPVQVKNLPPIVQVAASQFHALALDESGKVWAWGLNGSGQLGDGEYVDSSTPVAVHNVTDVKAVGTGYRMSWALKNDGTVWVWGADCKNNTHTEYQKFLKEFENSDDLAGTYFDSDLSSIDDESEAANCLGEQWINIHSPTPVQVAGLADVIQVSAGFGHFLVLKKDGTVWSWGCNLYGQVGSGFMGNQEIVKTPQQVMGLPRITAISAGFRHSLALDDAGVVWAWGSNHKGESGQAISDGVLTPQPISGVPPVTLITAGQEYSLAVDKTGTVWGWGENGYTQLGIDGPLYTVTPNKLHEDWQFSQLDAGGGHVVGVAIRPE